MNDKFYSLRVPTKLRGGKFRDKWVVCTYYSCGEPYGYLHGDNEIYEYWIVADSYTSGIFETRFEALIEIKLYYQRHAEVFPYVTEITEFCELRLPQAFRSGRYAGKWIVNTNRKVDGKPFGYLHNDNKLYDMWFDGKPATAMLESQLDALMEIKKYYHKHDKSFPYAYELTEAIIACATLGKNADVIKSQTMVFK